MRQLTPPSRPGSEPLIPPIIIDTSPPAASPLLSTLFAPGGWLFSYAAATVITGVMLLVLWAWKVSHDYAACRRLRRPRPPIRTETEPEPESVGRITGMADCRWADPAGLPRRAQRPSPWAASTPWPPA